MACVWRTEKRAKFYKVHLIFNDNYLDTGYIHSGNPNFDNKYIIVSMSNKQGIIDYKGNKILPCRYDVIY